MTIRNFSGTMTIRNVTSGQTQQAQILHIVMSCDRLVIHEFRFDDWPHAYSLPMQRMPDGAYRGHWSCRDGRTGEAWCTLNSADLSVRGTWIEKGRDRDTFDIELYEEDD